MKKNLSLVLLVLLSQTVFSQRNFFVYLQAEKEQEFYIRFRETAFHSSRTGYLILPGLADSVYTLRLGFPGRKGPEEQFVITMAKRDHGYLLREKPGQGWELYDLFSKQIISAVKEEKESGPVPNETAAKVSAFTALLAKATGDPSLLTPPAPVKTEPAIVAKKETIPAPVTISEKKDTIIAVAAVEAPRPVSPDTLIAKKEPEPVKPTAEPVQQPVETGIKTEKSLAAVPDTVYSQPAGTAGEIPVDTVRVTPVDTVSAVPVDTIRTVTADTVRTVLEEPVNTMVNLKKSVIKKRSESSTTEGFGLVYLDNWEDGQTDTIRLLIPQPKLLQAQVKEIPREEKKFLEIPAVAVKDTIPQPVKTEGTDSLSRQSLQTDSIPKAASEPERLPPMPAPVCADTATDHDFRTLRKNMAAAEGDEQMLQQARSYFKEKCFTAAQLKNLSTLFLEDEGKYSFFDAAYKYVRDKDAFALLVNELKDPYYINRFKAMLR